MKILVWKGYGEIDVYCAETVNHLKHIAQKLSDCVEDFGDDYVAAAKLLIDGIDEIEKSKPHNLHYTEILRKINVFIRDWCDASCDNDSFEKIYFDKVNYD